MDVDAPENLPSTVLDVSGGTSPQKPGQADKNKDETDPQVDGVIGQLEVYRNGVVKMRLGNGIVLDVRIGSLCPCLRSLIYVTGHSSNPTIVPAACGPS